jgi:fluoride ion exporter CrcB/FEX
MDGWPIFVGAGVLIVSLAGLLYLAASWDAKVCADRGGKISSKIVTGFGVGGNGGVTTISTVSLCLSPDGRILGQ